jgi:hypothetical protein
MARKRNPNSNHSIARRLGISAEGVRQAKLDGRISPDADVDTAEIQWVENTDPLRGRPRCGIRSMDRDTTLARVRAERESIRLQLDQLKLDQHRGQLVDAAAVREAGAELAELLRQGLEQLLPELIQTIDGARSAVIKDRAGRAVLERWRADFAALVEQRCRELTTKA